MMWAGRPWIGILEHWTTLAVNQPHAADGHRLGDCGAWEKRTAADGEQQRCGRDKQRDAGTTRRNEAWERRFRAETCVHRA